MTIAGQADATTTAPWWVIPLLSLAGVLISASAAVYISYERARHERKAALQQLRRETLVEFVSAGIQFSSWPPFTMGVSQSEKVEDYKLHAAQFYSAYVRGLLVFDSELQYKANRWRDLLFRRSKASDADELAKLGPDLQKVQDALVNHARDRYEVFGLPKPAVSIEPS